MRQLLILGVIASGTLAAQPLPERVLVVHNSRVPDSLAVANSYITKRAIPAANLCAISPSSPVIIPQAEYETAVRDVVRGCLNTVGKAKILYIVFSYQTPFKIIASSRQFSVDSAIADVWDEHWTSWGTYPGDPHPYYAFVQSQGNYYDQFVSLAAYRASPGAKNIYSVWRLDGPTLAIAHGLVDKAMAAEASGLSGTACLDRRWGNIATQPDSGSNAGDWDLSRAAGFAAQAGFSVVEDQNFAEFGTAPAPLRCDGAAFYAGWYSYNNYNDAFTWNTGAIGFHLDSASALDVRSGTNWVANALLRGITLTTGSVNEPFLDGLIHPDGFLRDLLGGANAGDAAFRHTAHVKWMVAQIGDPLYRPFAGGRAPFPLPPQDWLVIHPQAVLGGTSTVGYVGLAAPAPAAVTVTLTSKSPAVATVPATVNIPAGADYATFPITTLVAKATSTSILNAAFSGKTLANTVSTVPLLGAVSVSPTSVTGGLSSTGTVSLNVPAPAGGSVVALTSSLPSVTVPATVTVPAGASSVNFPVTTSATASTVTSTITASLLGATKTATLTVTAVSLSTLTISPTSVTGGESATGTVTLSAAAGDGGVIVTLLSNRAQAVVPASVTVPAGATSANFPITTASVDAAVAADITATAGVSRTTRLTLQPVLQAISVSPTPQMAGASLNITISLVNPAPAGGRTIDLSSDNAAVPVPATATVAAGSRSVVVPVVTQRVAASTAVVIRATAGASIRTAPLTLEPVLISGIGGGTTVKGGLPLTISVQLGATAPPGGALVSLSSSNAAAVVPATVTVPAGAAAVAVTVTTTPVAASTPVTIRATGPANFRERVITVTP